MSKKSKTKTSAARAMIEPLEDRRLLSTVTSVGFSPTPSNAVLGQSVTFTANVLLAKTRQTLPTGTVKFFDGSTLLSKVNVVNTAGGPVASFTEIYFYKGTHNIVAKYSGDSLYDPGTSNTQTLTVSQQDMQTASDDLRTVTVTSGAGAGAVNGNGLSVNYYGYLNDGTEFDGTNLPGGGQFAFNLGVGKAIAGFDQGLQGIEVGETRVLIIPAALGYGSTAQPPSTNPPRPGIPANSRLTFIVQLVSNDYIPSKLVVTGANSTPITSGQAASTVAGTVFPATHVGASSAPLSIGLAAGTSAPINFTGSDYTVGGADPSDFTASDNQNTGFTITFSPTATGLRTAVVKIFTTDPATPTFRILVSGTGT